MLLQPIPAQMNEVVALAPAKINLHLEVLGLRPDGFHELAMVMQSLELADRLLFRPRWDGRIQLTSNNASVPLDGSNLIVKAAMRLRHQLGRAELGVDIQLDKRIPIGAGLAGGSSDAAASLAGLNRLWQAGLGHSCLEALAAELGSDVPFCLSGGTQLCFGRGERLEAIPQLGAQGLAALLLKHPEASVSTPRAYGRYRELRGDFYLNREQDFDERRQFLRAGPLVEALLGRNDWPRLRNDLQSVVMPEQPTVRQGLDLLSELDDSVAVAMSGSGPSVFALFTSLDLATKARQIGLDRFCSAGFESWVCGFVPCGVSLESPPATA